MKLTPRQLILLAVIELQEKPPHPFFLPTLAKLLHHGHVSREELKLR